MRLVLGDKRLSSCSLRPWLLMRMAEIAFEETKPLSPSRHIPALHDGELVVWDSLAICEYLAERFPEKNLWPAAREDRALARALCCEMHSGLASRARVEEIWSRARGPHLFGAFSIADAMFAPAVFRLVSDQVPIGCPIARAYAETILALAPMKAWAEEAAAEAAARGADLPPSQPPRIAPRTYAVVFRSQLRGSAEGYEETAVTMLALARRQPGFLGVETARGADGFGITVSYWDSLEAIRRWRAHPDHRQVQEEGRARFYARYDVEVCSVERAYRSP